MRVKRPSSRTRLVLLVAATAIVLYGLAGGCTAQRLPPAASPEQAGLLNSAPLPYSVVVTPWDSATAERLGRNADAYASSALDWLRSSGAFTSVRQGSASDTDADLTATPTGEYCNTAVIPLWTGLTLGLVPTVFTDSTCNGVVLRPASGGVRGADSLVVRHSSAGRVVMGWAAIPVGFLPGWTHGEAKNHPRYARLTRNAILARSTELAALKRE